MQGVAVEARVDAPDRGQRSAVSTSRGRPVAATVVPVVLDNSFMHCTPEVTAWLQRHKRVERCTRPARTAQARRRVAAARNQERDGLSDD